MVRAKIPERRKFPRTKHVLCIYHRLYKRKGKLAQSHWNSSITENMSLGGVLFASNVHYQLNDLLQLKVFMSGALNVFEGYGKVVRIDHRRVISIYKTAICFAPPKNKTLPKAKSKTKPRKK